MGVMEDRRRLIAAQPHLVTAFGETLGVAVAEPKINRLAATFAPVQTGSGTPSPSNVRPIYGWTEIPTQMCGKNLIPPTIYRLANSQGAIVEGDSYRSLIAVVNGGATYTISRNAVSGNRFRVYATREYPASGVPSVSVSSSGDNDLQKTITVPDGYSYLLVYLSNSGDDITSTIQLELGSTATAYEPYRGITATADLGGTYYGGTVDLVSGVMTVTWGTLDLGSLNYFTVENTGGNLFRTTATRGTIRPADWMSGVLEAKCQIYISRSGDETYRGVYDYSMGTDGTGQLYIYDSSRTGMTAAEFKSSVSGIPLVYRYIDPITVTLTPQTIAALRGQQTVTSPAGAVEISYWTN